MEPNILLTRIDNRLVHGQVGVTWTTSLGANLLIVADDDAAKDPIQQQLMSMTAESSGVGIRFFTIEHTIDIIRKASPKQKIFIVCKTPKGVRRLVEGNVPLKEVNVGNMHFSEGKRSITKKVYVNDEDMEDLKFISSKGINVFAQDTPGDIKTKIE
ncbi:MAG: agaB [Clostridiaceae bacterium]|jgi:PTS system galactosamine-specific IIB component|nr:agaB [Clostridiaceae bacterium]